MMNSFKLTLGLLFCTSVVLAQQIISENQFLLHENKGALYRFVDDQYEPELSLYKFYTVTNYQKEHDTKYYRQLNEFRLNSETLELVEVLEHKENVNGKIMGMHNIDPNFLQEPEPEFKIYDIQILFQNFNIKYLSEDQTKVISNKSEAPAMEGKPVLKPKYHVNYADQTALVVYGEKKKGKEYKNNEHKNLTLIKLDRDANTVMNEALALDHPRTLLEMTAVSSDNVFGEDQQGDKGVVLLFDKPRGMKTKDNHPDMNSYLVVYIDNVGDVKYQHKIEVEGVKQISPTYAYELGNDIVLLSKTYGSVLTYTSMIFDETGMKNMIDYPIEVLNEGVDSKLRMTSQYYFDVDYHSISEEGNVILAGHGIQKVIKTIPSTENTPGRSETIRKPYLYDIMSFDSDLTLIKNFATRTNVYSKPELVSIKDELYLMFSAGSDPRIDFGLSKTLIKRVKNASGQKVKAIKYVGQEARKDSAPIIVKMEPNLPSINFDKKNLYNINDELRYFVSPSGEITFLGLKGNNDVIMFNSTYLIDKEADDLPVNIYMVKVKF